MTRKQNKRSKPIRPTSFICFYSKITYSAFNALISAGSGGKKRRGLIGLSFKRSSY